MRRRPVLVAALAVAALVSAGCGAGGAGGDAGQQFDTGGTFTMAISNDPGAWDIYHSNTTFGSNNLMYDSLVNVMFDGKIETGLAQKWDVDAHQATFTLRKGVTCSDGTALTASQVADDLNYMDDPTNGNTQYGTYTPTLPFTATADDATGVVKVVMKDKPFGFLLYTVGVAPIVCAKGFKDPKSLDASSDGTGPYTLTGVVPGQSYTFTVRKDYAWGPNGATTNQPGQPGKIVMRVISNETTAANLLLSGQVNYAQITGPDRNRLTARGLRRYEDPRSSLWLFMNHRDNRLLADEKVRQALIQALDLPQVVKVSTDQVGSAANGLEAMQPKICAGDTEAGQLPKFDVSAANALLDQDGWTRGPDGIRTKDGRQLSLDMFDVPSLSVGTAPTAELLAQRWQSIGVKVTQRTGTLTDLSKTQTEGNFDILLQPFNVNLPTTMVPELSGPIPPNGFNFTGVQNAEYEANIAKAQTMVPPAACQYWNQAEQALFRAVDVVPMSNQPGYYYVNKADVPVPAVNAVQPTTIKLFK